MNKNWFRHHSRFMLKGRKGLAAGVLACLLGQGAAPTFAQQVDPLPIYDGEWQYDTYCATCHGYDGRGIYALGISLRSDFVTSVTPEVLISIIQQGRYNRNRTYPAYPGMPAFPYIREAQARDLVEYMQGPLQQAGGVESQRANLP